MRGDGSREHRLLAAEKAGRPSEYAPASPDDHFQGRLSWSPDGERIAFSGGHCHCISIFDVRTGIEHDIDTPWRQRLGGLSWSPDGAFLGSAADPRSSLDFSAVDS